MAIFAEIVENKYINYRHLFVKGHNLTATVCVCGTVCPQTYDLRCNSGHSSDNSKQYCLVDREHGA